VFSDQWPEKVGKGLMFISLNVEPETHEAAVAALDALCAEFEARGLPVRGRPLGYRLLVVEDLDGNQLFLHYSRVGCGTPSGRIPLCSRHLRS
jgi:hypothetical protein